MPLTCWFESWSPASQAEEFRALSPTGVRNTGRVDRTLPSACSLSRDDELNRLHSCGMSELEPLISGIAEIPGEPLQPPNAYFPTEPRLLAPIAAVVIAGLYLLYVTHFSTNFPIAEEWSVVPLVHAALHGHLTWRDLWTQHFESRMLFPNLIFVAAGFIDRYDLRAIILLNGLLLVASYVLLLGLTRRYLRSTPHSPSDRASQRRVVQLGRRPKRPVGVSARLVPRPLLSRRGPVCTARIRASQSCRPHSGGRRRCCRLLLLRSGSASLAGRTSRPSVDHTQHPTDLCRNCCLGPGGADDDLVLFLEI